MWREILPRIKKNKFYMEKYRIFDTRLHDHAFLEFAYILSGSVKHTRDGQKNTLSAGDYFIMDFGSLHSYESADGEYFENLNFLFLPELLDPVLKGTYSLRALFEHYLLHFNMQALSQNPARMIFHDDDGRILSILKQMQKESDERQAGYTEMIRCCLIQILLITVRKLEDSSIASTGQDISSCVAAYVAEHYMQPITLGEIAKKLNYSLSYVSKKFKEDMGISFVKFLQNYRVTQGCRLLLSTKRTISDISEAVGYSDVKFFVTLVKKITGESPSAFRKTHLGTY